MRFEPRAILLILVLTAPATLSRAATTSFSDGIFNDADWSAAVISASGPPVSFTAQQVTAGGDPGDYRQVQHVYGGQGSIVTGHLLNAAVYDPASQGAVERLDFSFSIMLLNGGNSNAVLYGPLLFQNGSYYVDGTALTTLTPTTNVWVDHAFVGLEAGVFGLVTGPGPATPDFSANGGVIQFGYFASNGTAGAATETLSGLDNWFASATPVPEPDAALLIVLGLLVCGFLRYRSTAPHGQSDP